MEIKEICKRIRCLQIEKNLKLESVAMKADMSVTGYGNIERGMVNNLSLKSIIAIAKALNLCVTEILLFEKDDFILMREHEVIVKKLNDEIQKLNGIINNKHSSFAHTSNNNR